MPTRASQEGEPPLRSTDPVLVQLWAARSLLRADAEDEVMSIVLDATRSLGATPEPPTATGVGQVPIDLTFGLDDPLVPAGSDEVLAVVRAALPSVVADAHMALDHIRRVTHIAEWAAKDTLTGLANRRRTMRVLSRLGPGDVLAMIDLDHFKEVNDTRGHEAGDAALQAFARALRGTVRAADTAGRIGGEEFALLLPGTGIDGALELLRRLEELWISIRTAPVTFSAGVAAVTATGGRDALRRADAALYAAKAAGRDRVEIDAEQTGR